MVHTPNAGAATRSPVDPVCGMAVPGTDPGLQTEYADVTYHFCSRGCMDRFHEQPDIFTAQPGKGRVANDDRALRDDEHEGALAPGTPARLSNPAPDAGPG